MWPDGRPAKAWSLAVGNGKRPPTWSALPPGESVTMTWSKLGGALFPAPGRYTLVLTYDGDELPAVTVDVVP